jgi:hypothetical protein
MTEYRTRLLVPPARLVKVQTAWYGVERIIFDLIHRFDIVPENALEFGVDYGYSTAAFANYFKKVVGVDKFDGDPHVGVRDNVFEKAQENLAGFPNIELHRCDYREWIASDDRRYDLIHVDIIHNYEDTYACGAWAVEHSDVTIFHDTQSFPEVMRAVKDIACNHGRKAYNWTYMHGLGILSNRERRGSISTLTSILTRPAGFRLRSWKHH